jgi:hypothetical protein
MGVTPALYAELLIQKQGTLGRDQPQVARGGDERGNHAALADACGSPPLTRLGAGFSPTFTGHSPLPLSPATHL